MNGSFAETMRLIEDAVRSVRPDEFDSLLRDCLAVLGRGNKIIASGLGKNVPICEKFVGTLVSLGFPASFMHTNSAVHGDLGLVRDGDLVIVLTKSGETVESAYLVRMLEKRKCVVWLLSFNRDSRLCRELPNHLIIKLEHEGDPWNLVPNNSTVLNLIVLQELAMRLARELRVGAEELRLNHPAGHIGELLRRKT